jgi:hypothetical protein
MIININGNIHNYVQNFVIFNSFKDTWEQFLCLMQCHFAFLTPFAKVTIKQRTTQII